MKYGISLLAVVVLLLAGCSQPLPEDRLDYAGLWQAENMYLLITADGRVDYQRSEGGRSSSVSAPIKEFVGDDFVAGVAFATTTFEVAEPPRLNNGQWEMVVDGVRVTRLQGE